MRSTRSRGAHHHGTRRVAGKRRVHGLTTVVVIVVLLWSQELGRDDFRLGVSVVVHACRSACLSTEERGSSLDTLTFGTFDTLDLTDTGLLVIIPALQGHL